MKIYKITRNDTVKYDEYDSAVVVARDKEHVLEIVALKLGWMRSLPTHDVTIEEVNSEIPGVVVASFNSL